MAESFDVAIVGSGAIGLSAALACAQGGLRTALIGPLPVFGGGRTVALFGENIRFLEALGLWPPLSEVAAPLSTLRIVDSTGGLFQAPEAAFHARDINLDQFGWNVETAHLVAVMHKAAQNHAGLTLYPAFAERIQAHSDAVHLCLADGRNITTRLTVGADGRRSKVRDAAGIEARTWSYPQVALTAVFTHTRDHANTSIEFHTREGPFTLVPLQGRRSSLVWVTKPRTARRLKALDDASFAKAVERQAHSCLGEMEVEGLRGDTPLTGLSVDRLTTIRTALIGEAAHVLPPIGAQGLNLGLMDAAALVKCAISSHEKTQDAGDEETLKAYEQARGLDIKVRTSAVDALNRSLISSNPLVGIARSAGLGALSQIGPLRHLLMRRALAPFAVLQPHRTLSAFQSKLPGL